MKVTHVTDAPDGPMDPTHFAGRPSRRDYGEIESPDGTAIVVSFPAGARTHWHHHLNGQILYVVAGAGRVGTRDGTVEQVGPGDLVYAPPNEEHWHGATDTERLEHLALNFGTTTWHEPVED